MADFYIQTDKESYFAGYTVNGNVLINVSNMITGAQGVSLSFTGYECVKWVEAKELHRPRPNPNAPPGTPPPYDPIEAIPPHYLRHRNNEVIYISDVEDNNDRSFDDRPKYIRTPSDRYFYLSYYETRNLFTYNKSMIYQCTGFALGQYSFPFSFKTFEGWPASFKHITPRKKGVIIYTMTVAIEPRTSSFNVSYRREITLCYTRMVTAQSRTSNAEIKSCCCFSKGITTSEIHFEKDGYAPGELVQMIMEVDNSNCSADIPTISIGITNSVRMSSSGRSTSDNGQIMSKEINGLGAGQKAVGPNAIREAFNLQSNKYIKPTCSGKLLSNTYELVVTMNHDVACLCCSDRVGTRIPIIIFPPVQIYQMPNIFTSNWAPQAMPATNMAVVNNFNNFQISQMQPQQYPPVPQQGYPQQGYPVSENSGMQMY